VYNTEYRTVTDLTNRMYFFELTTQSEHHLGPTFDRLKLDEATGSILV